MLHYRHNNFYAPVSPSERDRRQRKQIIDKETDTTAIMLHPHKKETGYERPKDTSTKKNNNTMDTEFLVQMRQSNKCGIVRNDEIFNLHLGSSAGP